MVGLRNTADKILEDKSILLEADFNATKTWVEYVNRLVGVMIGLLIVGAFILSWPLRTTRPELFLGALGLLALVIFQGWFGSIVVSTNLTSWTITVHMLLAVVMVILLVWLMVRSSVYQPMVPASLRPWLVVGILAFVIQTLLGTEVRAALDRLATLAADRGEWIRLAGADFLIHRSFSWVIILIQVGIYFKLRKTNAEKASYLVSILLILCSVLTGSAMVYFGVPAAMQPVHLLVAVISIGWMFQVYLQASGTETKESVK